MLELKTGIRQRRERSDAKTKKGEETDEDSEEETDEDRLEAVIKTLELKTGIKQRRKRSDAKTRKGEETDEDSEEESGSVSSSTSYSMDMHLSGDDTDVDSRESSGSKAVFLFEGTEPLLGRSLPLILIATKV